MTIHKILENAEILATDLLAHASDAGMTGEELIQVTVCAERLLQRVLFQGNCVKAREAVLTAHATFDAASQTLDTN